MKSITKIAITAIPLVLAGSVASADTFVRMLAGPAGGSWYPFGAKIMEMADKQIKGISTSNGPGGGVGNMRDVNKKNAEFGWTFGNTAYDGYTGRGKFKSKLTNVRFFANLFPGVLQTAVPAKSSIHSYKDLADKRLSPGKTTFSGNVAFEKLLKLYGITYAGVKKAGGMIQRAGYSDSVALMQDGHIDAFVGLTTAPNSSFLQLDFNPGIRLLSIDDATANKFIKQNPGFIRVTIKGGTYKNIKEDVPTIAAPTVIVVNKDVPDDIVYQMAKVLWENHAELVKVHKSWNSVTLKNAITGAAIPVHPGALRYYREKGVAK